MMRRRYTGGIVVAAVALVFMAAAAPAAAGGPAAGDDPGQGLEIPHEKFVLENGLTLIVHEDGKAPIAAVNVWYHVGSKNEKPGRTGFAHLFEHLMFNGSENFDDDYFQAMAPIGATDLNGTTNEDRTNYFQNVPVSALDTVLWLESDRMGHLLGAITQEKLDEQRGVVQNEKRQWENQPYALSYQMMVEATYPKGHPYSWSVIGSMEDLDAATLEDVHEWFKKYYGAANAVVVVAGDVEAEDVKRRVEKYFGDIPSGPPVARYDEWIAKMEGTRRQVAQDRVPQARLYKVWNIPPFGHAETIRLELLHEVLTSGKNSRLYKRLVYDEQIATEIGGTVDDRQLSSQFHIEATARPGGDLAAVEAAVDEELARILEDGPTGEEVERARTGMIASLIRGAERIGGFGGKSDILAQMEVYAGDSNHYRTYLRHLREATPETIHAAARKWLSDGQYVLEIHPFPRYGQAEAGADRSKPPEPGEPPAAVFPELHRATLSNGLEVVLAERHAVPVVGLQLVVDAGYASDHHAVPGTARLAMDMLDEGTETRDALQISLEADRLGARLQASSDLDSSTVSLSALKAHLDDSLALLADVALRPSFPQGELDRLKKLQLAAIQREKTSPREMGSRVFASLLYGEDHPYGMSFTGTGTEDAVAGLDRDDLIRFHRTWFRPNNATLVVVGDTTLAEIRPKLEALFAGWEKGEVPEKEIATVEHKGTSKVYLIDRPGSQQSIIMAGHVAPPRSNPDEIAYEAANGVLGGTFTARLNMNLREDKHWSYGASSRLLDARGQRPFVASAGVQTDKTAESMVEFRKELEGIVGKRPIEPGELKQIQEQRSLRLAGSWETSRAVAGEIVEMVTYDLPEDHFATYAEKIRALDLERVSEAAGALVHPDRLVWVIVGDRAVVEPGIEKLGWGEIRHLDADGKPVGPAAVEE